MKDNRRIMLHDDNYSVMVTEPADDSSEERKRTERRELVRAVVKRDMERNADIYDDLASE